MKRLSLLLILLFVCAWSQSVSAQAVDSWVNVSLKDEQLTVQMPKSREEKSQELSFEKFKLEGRVYTATEDGVDYIAWSLVDKANETNEVMFLDTYLDNCADLVWESILKPRRDKIPEESPLNTRMSYQRNLIAINLLHGREYSVIIGNRSGLARFFALQGQIYILIVLNEDANSVAAQRFIKSFGPTAGATEESELKLQRSVTGNGIGIGRGGGMGPGVGTGIGAGRGGNMGGGDRKLPGSAPSAAGEGIDYNRIFSGKDVTEKARILSKPEPQYPESARKYSVKGTVVLRAVFSSSGQVTQIRAVQRLPHGMTERSIAAARNIKFIPATKDGHQVSMWFQLEYNYNLY